MTKSLCLKWTLKFWQKYESFKMGPVRLSICTISASFVPNLADVPLLVSLNEKIPHIRRINVNFNCKVDYRKISSFWGKQYKEAYIMVMPEPISLLELCEGNFHRFPIRKVTCQNQVNSKRCLNNVSW